MKKKDSELSRRDFLRKASTATLIGAVGVSSACDNSKKEPPAAARAQTRGQPVEPAAPPAGGAGAAADKAAEATPESAPAADGDVPKKAARVVLVRDDSVLDEGRNAKREVLAKMVDDGVVALLGAGDAAAAWARLIRPDDVVAIKSNHWRFLRTPPALEEVLRERVEGAGVPADRIAIADRNMRKSDVFKNATALVNVRPMRTHHWSGVGSLLKNYINLYPEPSEWHGDSCANLAGLWEMPSVKGKTRLNILVMMTPLFHGKGPHHFHAKYTWAYRGLLIGTDPVAVDSTGLRILEAKRAQHFGKNMPFAVEPKHIRVAQEKYGLGIADPDDIELVRIGTQKDVLI